MGDNREANISNFDKNWEIDLREKQIKRIPLTGVAKFIDQYIYGTVFTVESLYWWSVRKWATQDMMPVSTPLVHDDVIIKGIPRKYKLINDWTIPKNDLKYLIKGPLADKNGNAIVHHKTLLEKAFSSLIIFLTRIKWLAWVAIAIGLLNYFK